MSTISNSDQNDNRSGNILFTAVVVIAYLTVFISPLSLTPLELIILIILGLVYILIGTYGWGFCERSASTRMISAYFAVQLILSAVIIYVGLGQEGFMALIMFPLAGHSASILPLRWTLVVCALILLIIVVPIGLFTTWSTALQASISITALLAFVVVFTRITVREQEARAEVERLAAELSQANRKLGEYAAQVEELAITQERNRLAREIHDGLGHYLTVINVQLEAARTILNHDPSRALDALGKAQSLTQEGLTEIRRSVAALRASPIEGRSLSEAVAMLVEESSAAGIATELVQSGTPRSLPPRTKLTLYRAAQEGLTNVRKHAQATQVKLMLDYSDQAVVRLSVQDNGVGQEEGHGGQGFGLLGIQERVVLLGGRICTRSQTGPGFTLEVEVPG